MKAEKKVLTDELLQEIVRRIVAAVHPQKIILFGSAARGEMGPDSDVDLLVVKSCRNRRETARRIRRKLIGVGVPKDIIVATPEDIERYKDTIGLIYRPALREGKVLYAA
jgi:predicted nucleotidyltransferase